MTIILFIIYYVVYNYYYYRTFSLLSNDYNILTNILVFQEN